MSIEVQGLLQELSDLLLAYLPTELPPLRDIQHQVDLLPGAILPNLPHCQPNPKEQHILQQIVEVLLQKQFIYPSISPFAGPALIVSKKDGAWRLYIESRVINLITIKYRFPMPRFEDILDKLHGARIFFKLNIQSGYPQIRIREGDEWKTTFKTSVGLYEWRVLPFGLCNALATFMRLMRKVL